MSQSLSLHGVGRSHELARGGTLFVTLFALPFCAIGVFAAGGALVALGRGEPFDEELLVRLVLGAVFSVAGFGLLFLIRWAKTREARSAALRARYPDAPWRWRPEWAEGRVSAQEGPATVLACVFAFFWNASCLPFVFEIPGFLARGGSGAVFVLLFPAIGIGLLVWAVRAVLRRRRFGRCVFELATLPGVVGGALRGTIHVSTPIRPEEGVATTLACLNRVTTGSGKNRSTTETELWREDAVVPPTQVMAAPVGSAIPVAFTVPGDAHPSSPEPSSDEIVWRLRSTASLPGVDFRASFEVPVFRTEASDETLGIERPQGEPLALSAAPAPVAPGSRITAAGIPGGVELHFPAARSPAGAALLTVFALVWNGFVAFAATEAPPFVLPFLALFFLIGLLLGVGALDLWLGTIRLRVRGGGIESHRRLLLLHWTRVHPRDEIEGLSIEATAHVGSRAFYGLKLRRRGRRRPATLADGLGARPVAERVLRIVEDALAS